MSDDLTVSRETIARNIDEMRGLVASTRDAIRSSRDALRRANVAHSNSVWPTVEDGTPERRSPEAFGAIPDASQHGRR